MARDLPAHAPLAMDMRTFFLSARSLLSPLLDLAFPPLCLACGMVIERASDLLCARCQSSLVVLQPNDSVYVEELEKLTRSGVVDGLVSVYPFEKAGPLQALVHALKYDGATSIGSTLGALLGSRLTELDSVPSEDVLVPIPLHKTRLRERGYNQAEVIAKGMSRVCGAPVHSRLLIRRRNTVSQTTLSLQERRENVAGAFWIRPGCEAALRDKRALLVDDVITTGSTLLECARLLKEQGARAVVGCSIALAVKDSNS